MNGITHPYSKDEYDLDDGRVRITRPDGRVGWFAADGRWLEGERFDADPHLCDWISGTRGVHRMAPADEGATPSH